MFLFKVCCQQSKKGKDVQVKGLSDYSHYATKMDGSIARKKINDDMQSPKKSNVAFEERSTQEKSQKPNQIESQYSPDKQISLGSLSSIGIKWKRISDMVSYKYLMADCVEPKNIISCFSQQSKKQSRHFLSAVAALAENKKIIKDIFQGQSYNTSGIYKVKLKINGQIREITVDDLVPVNELTNRTLFSRPTSDQMWVPILEKAWAKALGSYANLIGKPSQVFKALTFAPSEQLIFEEDDFNQKQRIWNQMIYYTEKGYLGCCFTNANDQQQQMDLTKVGLIESELYTFLGAATLPCIDNFESKVVKLRSLWHSKQSNLYLGPGCQEDKQYWDKIKPDDKKRFLQNKSSYFEEGIFTISYDTFCKYFAGMHVSLSKQNGHYSSKLFNPNEKKGFLYEFNVITEGNYIIQIDQHTAKVQTKSSKQQQDQQHHNYHRATIILGKKDINNQTYFEDGLLTMPQTQSLLSVDLQPGKYIVYAKLDTLLLESNKQIKPALSQMATLSIYSSHFTQLIPQDPKYCPNFLQKMFILHGKQNERRFFYNTKDESPMWVTSKLLYKQGGYAYILFCNEKGSKKKFIVTFNEKDFNNMGFKLKKPYKNKGSSQRIEVLPGQETIILARVQIQREIKALKFPPLIDISTQQMKLMKL